jgi:CBS domain-containing protein
VKTVREILAAKGPHIWSIGPDASVFEAIAEMADKGCGALVVTEGPNLVGIVSERDYARKVILNARSSKDTHVREIMTSEVITADPRLTIEDAMKLMTERRIRHLPVVDKGSLVGVISLGDLVKTIIDEQRFVIGQLENYITH